MNFLVQGIERRGAVIVTRLAAGREVVTAVRLMSVVGSERAGGVANIGVANISMAKLQM